MQNSHVPSAVATQSTFTLYLPHVVHCPRCYLLQFPVPPFLLAVPATTAVPQGFAAGNATLAASRLATIQRMAALQRAAEERIASLEQQLNSTKAQLSNMQAEANEARADLDATIEDMKALQADLDAARQEVRGVISPAAPQLASSSLALAFLPHLSAATCAKGLLGEPTNPHAETIACQPDVEPREARCKWRGPPWLPCTPTAGGGHAGRLVHIQRHRCRRIEQEPDFLHK